MVLNDAIKNQGAVPEGYVEIQIEFFRFSNPGDFIAGRLLKKETQKVGNSLLGKYTISQDNTHKQMAFLGSVHLDEKMNGAKVGDEIWVQFTHEDGQPGANKMKYFKLFVKATR